MNKLRLLLLHLSSERDNMTPDVVRVVGGVLALLGGIEYLILAAWDVIVNKVAFAHEAFGIGLSTIIAAIGAAVAVKAVTEKRKEVE